MGVALYVVVGVPYSIFSADSSTYLMCVLLLVTGSGI